ncbi:MAG: DUF4918 family protein [Bacteroidales bacterium]|nr:DUF4918 family protein [Bacteroidales bacterium]
MKTFAGKALEFYHKLNLAINVPEIEVMNPYIHPVTFDLVTRFLNKYYADDQSRAFIFGINPGRFGAGVTGISFTDPINLEMHCGIPNHLPKKHELSSIFIYRVIEAYGGADQFFSKFFITAVSPLGFTKDGKNINYYDQLNLRDAVYPFALKCLNDQFEFGANTRIALCIGGDKNFRFLNTLNSEVKLFKEIIPLEHPRFIMQYRRKSINEFLIKYLNALKNCE